MIRTDDRTDATTATSQTLARDAGLERIKIREASRNPTALQVVLMVSSASQIVDDVKADRAMHLGAHHGVLLMGLIQILGVLPDFVEALERWLRGWDEKMGLPPIE
ncbi:MAG: hypothetical protein U0903_14385 [Planctomycetales bacterium]